MEHERVAEEIGGALRSREGIRALFLGGSHGTGDADAYSDVDFVLVAGEGATDGVAQMWREAVGRLGEIVLWWRQAARPALINAITADWLRVDVVILKPDQLGAQRQDALRVVFDHDGLYDALAPVTVGRMPDAGLVRYRNEEFIRILGLLPLAVGREEYLNGVLGMFHLRNLLVELMIAETGVRHRGGLLHLNRLTTQAQRDVLTALPPAVPERAAMIAGHMEYAAAYLPRARRLAADWGVEWPERFEEVTWSRLEQTLGLTRPY